MGKYKRIYRHKESEGTYSICCLPPHFPELFVLPFSLLSIAWLYVPWLLLRCGLIVVAAPGIRAPGPLSLEVRTRARCGLTLQLLVRRRSHVRACVHSRCRRCGRCSCLCAHALMLAPLPASPAVCVPTAVLPAFPTTDSPRLVLFVLLPHRECAGTQGEPEESGKEPETACPVCMVCVEAASGVEVVEAPETEASEVVTAERPKALWSSGRHLVHCGFDEGSIVRSSSKTDEFSKLKSF